MRLASVPDGTLGCDTYEPLTPQGCIDIIARGCKFVVRYLDNLTAAELTMILSHGLVVFFVHSCREEGWIPTETDGTDDGLRDVRLLRALGIPAGVHITFDLEEAGGTAADVALHVNAHGRVVKSGGFLPALYFGAGCLVNAQECYALISVLYWRSCSEVAPSEPQCGVAMVQAFKPNQIVGTSRTEVDFNMAMSDYKGRSFIGVAA